MSSAKPVAIALGISICASIAFAVIYVLGAQTQWEAVAAWVALGALAAALVLWERRLMPHQEAIEERHALPSAPEAREEAARALCDGTAAVVGRRNWLVVMLGGAFGAFGLAALFPLASFTPSTHEALTRTAWRKGARLVREDGTPVRASDLAVDSALTVFPEGHTGPDFTRDMANAATMLVRVPADELRPQPDRADWSPEGLLAYSKVCTHAGCPVGLYRAKARQLFCPCHQSTFDVLAGGGVVFGPAARGLPQLPIAIGSDGFLRAQDDFSEPIGPGYWERA